MLSDIHLGSRACQAQALFSFLSAIDTNTIQRIIINGDLLDGPKHKLKKIHWKILAKLTQLAVRIEVVWILGNHDDDGEGIAHLMGIKPVNEYEFEAGNVKFICVHGDVWDKFMSKHPWITNIADWFYFRLQMISRKVAIRAKRYSKIYVGCVEQIKCEAIKYAKYKKANWIITGHTHHPILEEGYANSGCWTNHINTYIRVAKDGTVSLRDWK